MAITRSEEIKSIIESSFSNDRAFSFYLNEQIVESLRSDDELTSSHDSLLAIRDASIDSVTEDKTARERLRIDARLTHALLVAITTVHKVAASQTRLAFSGRRFVIVAPNRSDSGGGQREPIVVHSGLGPVWREIPSLYLDLRIFTRIEMDEDAETVLARVLAIEERSVETGFDYIASDLEQKKRLISELYARIEPGVFTFPVVAAAGRGVTTVQRLPKAELFEMLDRRDPDSNLDFHHSAVLEAVRRLEEAASLADANDDLAALEDVVELLVTASGHDVHDARSRANIALERIFAPKEYDAPPATEFRTMTTGSTETILFHLPEGEKYVARIYSPEPSAYITTNEKLRIDESPLTRTDDGWELAITPTKIGFLDYVIVRPGESISRSTLPSGRINILPPVSGEIVLQIFPDIHGHTRVYWKRGDGHPGLVYNESGEVIRLGNFGDISEHLEDLKSRYQITGVYILGAQSRGKNTEDWAEGATSPSPFSPMSLTTMETGLGGDQAFRRLVDRAHELDIKVIVDILPHVNRASNALPEDLSVRCYDPSGSLVVRGSTDGRFGSWNDGKLLNYRRFEVWRWISESIRELVEQFDIDGIRIDSAHAVPIMMKKTNFPYEYNRPRTHEEMVRGAIIVNDREDDHYITTGYYDSECRDRIACPFYTFLARSIVEIISAKSDDYFVTYAECYWGRERYLARSGVIPYNSALFKICENITHGRSDIGEIYHLYDHYYRETLPPGTAMVGILGNHDERRALNTFGQRGVRAAIALTTFMSCIVLDYEGSAEGESWKVYMDNIFVNWNQFEFAAHRSLQGFYEEIYHFHRGSNEAGHLIRTNSGVVAAAIKRKGSELWIGAFSFSADNEGVGLEFDSDRLPIDDDRLYRLIDPVYSAVTGIHGYYAGYELKISSIRTMVAYTDRVKYLVLEERPESEFALSDVFRDSFVRLSYLSTHHAFTHSLAFRQFIEHLPDTQDLISATKSLAIRATVGKVDEAAFVLKRLLFHAARESYFDLARMDEFVAGLDASEDDELVEIGSILAAQQAGGDLIFITAEADPFSKSGGLANVLYELPRELARRGESVYVITPMYRNGTDQAVEKMQSARNRHRVRYTNLTVRFYIEHVEYEAGVHRCEIEGVTYLLFDHHEFFDGLYWGHTAEEKLRRRIALARCSAEIIRLIPLEPLFVFTNDAFAGPFNGIICGDQYYANHPVFKGTSFFHIIHNGGWQYFDSYDRYQNGKDLFSLFNLDPSLAGEFLDPVHQERLNCMAVGIRFADRSITVSPSYALQLREAGDGLERIVGDIVGINNAIAMDYSRRAIRNQKTSLLAENNRDRLLDALTADQALNRRIEQSFPEIFESIDAPDRISQRRRREIVVRMRNKLFMQLEFGLRIDPDAIVAVMLHRVTDQKGYQLLLEASGRIVTELGMQLIVGGPVIWDDEEAATLARGLQNLPGWYPGSVATRVGFQDVRVPLLGSELFLMPSRHEPGGISQLEALACGCLVVARATGGLRDTITPLVRKNGKITGNGTLFTDYNSEAFFDGICRFKATWDEFDDDERYSARISARKSVYYWGKPADRYIAETYGYKEIIHA